jgi:hypothetical protein
VTAIVLGTLAVAAIPVGVAAAVLLPSVDILPALYVAVPAAFILGIFGLSAARRARFKVDRSLRRIGDRTARFGRFLVWTGIYFALVGALALGFYGILRLKSS